MNNLIIYFEWGFDLGAVSIWVDFDFDVDATGARWLHNPGPVAA